MSGKPIAISCYERQLRRPSRVSRDTSRKIILALLEHYHWFPLSLANYCSPDLTDLEFVFADFSSDSVYPPSFTKIIWSAFYHDICQLVYRCTKPVVMPFRLAWMKSVLRVVLLSKPWGLRWQELADSSPNPLWQTCSSIMKHCSMVSAKPESAKQISTGRHIYLKLNPRTPIIIGPSSVLENNEGWSCLKRTSEPHLEAKRTWSHSILICTPFFICSSHPFEVSKIVVCLGAPINWERAIQWWCCVAHEWANTLALWPTLELITQLASEHLTVRRFELKELRPCAPKYIL